MPRKYQRRCRPRNSVRTLVKKEIQAHAKKTVEVKHKTISFSMNASSDLYGINLLDYISQGDTSSTRSGNRINLLSQSLRMNVSGETPYSTVRMIVCETRTPLAYDSLYSMYNGEECLQSSNLGVNSEIDFDVVKRVWCDKTFLMREIVSGVVPVRYLRKRLSFGKNGKKIFWDGNTTGPAATTNTQTYMYLLFMSDSAPASIVHPKVNLGAYLRYTDQ